MKKAIVSSPQNIFYDGKQVDHKDLSLEQEHNETRVASTIRNVVGSGVIKESLEERLLFDTNINNIQDGVMVTSFESDISGKTSDIVEGQHLAVELTNSVAAGERKVKVLLIGLDFNYNLQYDILYFSQNEIQITKKHYTQLVGLLINDRFDNATDSLNLGGRVVVKEADSLLLSKDLLTDDNGTPSLFFRDVFISSGDPPLDYIQSVLVNYDISQLNISTDFSKTQALERNDIVTQIGQKFIAKNNNIQKITVLMSVRNSDDPNDLVWDGQVIASLYPLQSTVSCINDIIPENKLDYAPTAVPLAQISFDYNQLFNNGYELDTVPQPVDLVFSNTAVSNGKSIKQDEAYALVLKRLSAGVTDKCDILFTSNVNSEDTRQLTIFAGQGWVNISTESLWYQIYSDNAKITSGQYYLFGSGVTLQKVKYYEDLGLSKDYCLDNLSFTTNQIYKAVAQTTSNSFDLEENPRTGNDVLSKKQVEASIKLLNTTEYNSLKNTDDNDNPDVLTLGAIKDNNVKYFVNGSFHDFTLHLPNFFKNKLFFKVITDSGDPDFEQSILDLRTMIITNEVKNAKLFDKNTNNPFRIVDAKIHDIVIGNYKQSTVDYDDLNVLSKYKDIDFNTAPENGPSVISVSPYSPFGYVVNPGYKFLTDYTTSTDTSVIVKLVDSEGVQIGIDFSATFSPINTTGQYQIDTSPTDIQAATVGVTSPSIIVVSGYDNDALAGKFAITSISSSTIATLQKPFMNMSGVLEAFAFDIDGDQLISLNDGYLLNSWLDKAPYVSYISPYPVVNPYIYMNTTYQVIELTLEKYVDRHDDYWDTTGNRSDIHELVEPFMTEAGFQDFTLAKEMRLTKQITWNSDDVYVSTDPRAVFTVYSDYENTTFDNKNVFPDPLNFEKNVNNYYNPGNFLIEGNILNENKNFHKLDFEVADIILNIPEGLDGYQKSLNILSLFVAEDASTSVGLTVKGFPALKYSDGTYVGINDIANIRYSAAIQSFTPELDGTYFGDPVIVVDGRMGLAISETGILNLNFTNLYNDPAYVTGNTKVKVTVFLKKAGFSNNPLQVNDTQVFNLLS